MTRLILVRNGQTDWTKQNRIQGMLDIPLNEKGRRQSIELAKQINIPIDVIFSSQLSRAYETANIITEVLYMKNKVKQVKELNELNQGLWQGLLVEEVRKRYKKIYAKWETHPSTIKPPQGESLNQVSDKVISGLEKIIEKYSSKNICLVTHKIITALIKIYYTHVDIDNLWDILPDNATWEILEVE